MNSNLIIRPILDLQSAADLIAECNNEVSQHVGYCGNKKEEILHTLLNDFSDLPTRESLIGAYDNNRLIGVLGLDVDMESQEAEIWGPFIISSDWNGIASKMWKQLIENLSVSIKLFHGFYSIENQKAENFMQEHDFSKGEEHIILSAKASFLDYDSDLHVQELDSLFTGPFIELHQKLFPKTYYDGSEILNRLNDERRVMIAHENDQLIGYVYFEASREFREGNIEYIGVSPNYRNMGIGSKLIKSALKQLFTEFLIEEIQLCVGAKNEKALKLYKKAGFVEKYNLIAYQS